MLRQAENKVKIEGILSEIDLKYGSFVKDGKTIETIGGTINVLVKQEINGVPHDLIIPVNMFSQKYKKDGNPNPAYTSIEKVMKEYVSIAAAGSEGAADKIRITNGNIKMNEYYNQNDQLVSFPRIHTSFVQKVSGDFKPEATFSLELAVSRVTPEVDKDGIEVEPKKLNVIGIVPLYGGKVDVVKLTAINPNVISAIEEYWEKDCTFKASGRLNFSSTTEEVIEQPDFGEPVHKVRTINVNELIITGGSQTPAEGEYAFPIEEIINALNKRKADLEASKTKAAGKKAPAPMGSTTASLTGEDLGF